MGRRALAAHSYRLLSDSHAPLTHMHNPQRQEEGQALQIWVAPEKL